MTVSYTHLDVYKRQEISVKALENATPETIPYEELDIKMGERWIDPQLYADFAADLFGVEAEVMYFDVNDAYRLVIRLTCPPLKLRYTLLLPMKMKLQ